MSLKPQIPPLASDEHQFPAATSDGWPSAFPFGFPDRHRHGASPLASPLMSASYEAADTDDTQEQN